MNKKILIILLIVFGMLTITGCGNTKSNDSNNEKVEKKESKKEEKEKDKKEPINKEVTCTNDSGSMIKTLSVEVKNSKAIKFVNTHTYTTDVNTWCPEMKKRYGSLNEIKGTSLDVQCDEANNKTVATETWILKDIEDFDALSGDEIPDQLTFTNHSTFEFYYDWFLEAMDTQNYTCEEK